jgi:predicted nicotinamide N-methyase
MVQMTEACSVLGFQMQLITPACPLYYATADELDALESEPWWAFVWPGSFALAELLQARPELVRGKRVLDVATGCGISAFASLQAGAAHVIANDIDPWSLHAVRMNLGAAQVAEEEWAIGAEAQGRLSTQLDNLIGLSASEMSRLGAGADVIIAGDICYEQPLASHVRRWLHSLLASETPPLVLVGDPGRAHFVDTFHPQSSSPSALRECGLDPRTDFPDGSLSGTSGSHPIATAGEEEEEEEEEEAAVGLGIGALEIVAVHRSRLSGMVADTSHGLHTATVWELRLPDRSSESG